MTQMDNDSFPLVDLSLLLLLKTVELICMMMHLSITGLIACNNSIFVMEPFPTCYRYVCPLESQLNNSSRHTLLEDSELQDISSPASDFVLSHH
jgi:hypothetical protein